MEDLNKMTKEIIDDFDGNFFIFALIVFSLGYLINNCLNRSGFTVDEYYPYDEMKKSTDGLINNSSNVGLEPVIRRPEGSPPSLEKKLQVLGPPQPMMKGELQMPSLKIQDGSIVLPFNEIWNPGFIPVDMAFKGAVSPGQAGYGPFGMDKPMKDTVPILEKDAVMEGNKATGEASLVLVYAPWCGHSKKMLPDYEKVKSELHGQMLNGKKMNIVMYNSDVDKDKVKEYGVKGFPSLFYEQDGDRKPFTNRDYDSIMDELKKLTS